MVGHRELGRETRAHGAEHVATDGGHDVDAQAGPDAVGQQSPGGHVAVAHVHLQLGRDGRGAAGIGHEPEVVLVQRVAVDVGGVGAQQTARVELDEGLVQAPQPITHVDRDAGTHLARQLPVVLRDVERGELGAARRHGEGDPAIQAVGRVEVLRPEPDHVPGLRDVAHRQPLRVAVAIGKHHPRAGLAMRLDHRVGVLRRVHVVGPVEQRRDAAVERLEDAHERAGVVVLGPEDAAQDAPDAREVLGQRPVGADVADERLPRVPVGVHEAGQHDHARRVHDLRVGARSVTRPTATMWRPSMSTSQPATSPMAGSMLMTCPPRMSVRSVIADALCCPTR